MCVSERERIGANERDIERIGAKETDRERTCARKGQTVRGHMSVLGDDDDTEALNEKTINPYTPAIKACRRLRRRVRSPSEGSKVCLQNSSSLRSHTLVA